MALVRGYQTQVKWHIKGEFLSYFWCSFGVFCTQEPVRFVFVFLEFPFIFKDLLASFVVFLVSFLSLDAFSATAAPISNLLPALACTLCRLTTIIGYYYSGLLSR
jgi:hypothetical protein